MAANSGAGDPGNLSQKILETGAVLLRDFIQDRVSRHASVPVTSDDLGGATVCDPSQKQLADCLRKIGDELDGNIELQQMIDSPQLKPTKEVFIQVACQIFSDGKFNWGRVVALFYLSCRLVIKALVTKIPEMIRLIIDWTLEYLREHLLNWIREQGGWEGIRSYFGTPTWQTVGVFLAGVLTTALVIRKM